MKLRFGWLFVLLLAVHLVIALTILTQTRLVQAAPRPNSTPTGPDRFTWLTIDITLYEWWLIAWKDNNIYCALWVDHEGLPTDNELSWACDAQIYNEWKAYSVPCKAENTRDCPGYYLQNVSSKSSKKEITVKLPPPQVWVSVENCNPDPDGWCSTQPKLILTGEEPLPNETITHIQGYAGNDAFSCQGARCEFSLEKTTSDGVQLQFWANSSYGDSSPLFTALVRVLTQGGESNEQRLVKRWYVDVLSTQWTGARIASCAITWDAFPPTEGLPEWLTTPEFPEQLTSSIPYAYLAGNLITQGVVDVHACPDGGLTPQGTASPCGLKAAQPAVEQWQNQFDHLIHDIALKTDVPAQLLKNLFSRESQFWPGVFRNGDDVGLGQLTENGADTTLLWNRAFFEEFCPLVLDKKTCENNSYSNLSEANQKLLRGALVASVNATCATCPLGIDISRANFSVSVFGRTLLANCEQTGKIIQNVTGKTPGRTLDYETLWKLTLVNYNAGPGCLSEAVQQAHEVATEQVPFGWDLIAQALDPACRGAIGYVEDISKPQPTPTPTPSPTPSPASQN
ncbi:MAG: hypothetical protein DDG60_08500 [Anaerolineae bacterium]|nr:MAG: hypothetical protein DDG60_08500 [Anaerolineae bacterium]